MEIANSILIIEKHFYRIKKRINIGIFAVETLGSSFTWFRHDDIYTKSIIFFLKKKKRKRKNVYSNKKYLILQCLHT